MKRNAISVVALLAAIFAPGVVLAEPRLAPASPAYLPPPPPPPLWTGWYAGLNAGYGFGTTSTAPTTGWNYDQFYTSYFTQPTWPPLLVAGNTGLLLGNSGNTNLDISGFIGGGQIGYNYQWSPNVVIGLEADFQGSTAQGSGSYAGAGQDLYSMGRMMLMPHGTRNVVGGGDITASLDWLGTVRGRIGYLFTPTLLIFGTGGLSYGGVSASANYASVSNWCGTMADACYGGMITFPYTQVALGSGRVSDTLVGWNAGGGVEWMFMPNWSLKAEAFYYDLGSLSLNGLSVAPASGAAAQMRAAVPDAQIFFPTTRIRFDGVVARVGVNYHFNWGGAPVAFQ